MAAGWNCFQIGQVSGALVWVDEAVEAVEAVEVEVEVEAEEVEVEVESVEVEVGVVVEVVEEEAATSTRTNVGSVVWGLDCVIKKPF
jgi:hypothetical protein